MTLPLSIAHRIIGDIVVALVDGVGTDFES
jgi:hypothetical protein